MKTSTFRSFSHLALAYAIVRSTDASPTWHGGSHHSRGGECTNFTIPVAITAQNHIYDVRHVDSNIDATQVAVDMDTWDSLPASELILDNITVSTTYDIYAQLCVPWNGAKKSHLLLATHGVAFDSRYWDAEIDPEEHSFVAAALNAGYSILTYDRIACGRSSKPSAYTDLQAPAEVEVLRGLAEAVRDGKIWDYASPASSRGPLVKFDKTIAVGHSFGSFMTYSFTSLYPQLSDAAVLTGFFVNKELFEARETAKGNAFAPQNDPVLFADSSSGYVVTSTPVSLQTGFFSARNNATTGAGGFDPKFLDYAFSIRQPSGVVETASGPVLFAQHPTAPQYKGPVQFVAGEFDFVICRGDCKTLFNATEAKGMYPQSPNVESYLQPGSGHALPLHRTAQAGFNATFEWLSRNGL